ncbi:MAG: S46 family peptidase [Candidatus Zixiibacteriota bacterium]
MRKVPTVCLWIAVIAALLVVPVRADEGMWPMFSLDQLNFDSLKAMGLKLAPGEIYNPDGSGLWGAVVQIGGGSGSFVSPEGLIVTNHHVAFGAIQSQSTAEKNYIDDGFLARTRAEEIPAIGYNCYVCQSFEDVTAKVTSVLKTGMSDLQRYRAIEKRTKQLVAQAEKGRDVKCEVEAFDGGRQYVLITYFKIQDIRIVAVPPVGIGNFGGEIDNWMWPRHTGDYSFLRAYVAPNGRSAEYAKENVPYHPRVFLPVSAGPLREGDFAMTIGYPGGTSRFESSFAIDEAVNDFLPTDIQYRRDMIAIMENAGKDDPEVAVRVEARIEGLANYLKNNEGMLTGLAKGHVLEHRQHQEEALTSALKNHPDLAAKYGQTLPGLRALHEKRRSYREKQRVLSWLGRSCRFYSFASRLNRWSIEKTKKDMDREPAYMERQVPALKRRLREEQVNLVPAVDRTMLIYMLKRAMALPADQRIAPLDRLVGDASSQGTEAAITSLADRLYDGTKVGTVEDRMTMFDMTREQLRAQNDPFIELAVALYDETETMRETGKEFDGALKKLNPELISAYRELGLGPRYPDANGTMRLTYGILQGYSPADAVHYSCFTTLTGVGEKETGKEPFHSPPALIEALRRKDFGRYLDVALGDVPVDFLTNHDTTGGSSGSPVVNATGALIGLCFDGNYESIAADYQFEPRVTRTINVDTRYILFTLDTVMGARELIAEMTVR